MGSIIRPPAQTERAMVTPLERRYELRAAPSREGVPRGGETAVLGRSVPVPGDTVTVGEPQFLFRTSRIALIRGSGPILNTTLSTFLPRSRQAGGSSSVGRARPLQGRCREFEPRLPLSGFRVANGNWIAINQDAKRPTTSTSGLMGACRTFSGGTDMIAPRRHSSIVGQHISDQCPALSARYEHTTTATPPEHQRSVSPARLWTVLPERLPKHREKGRCDAGEPAAVSAATLTQLARCHAAAPWLEGGTFGGRDGHYGWRLWLALDCGIKDLFQPFLCESTTFHKSNSINLLSKLITLDNKMKFNQKKSKKKKCNNKPLPS